MDGRCGCAIAPRPTPSAHATAVGYAAPILAVGAGDVLIWDFTKSRRLYWALDTKAPGILVPSRSYPAVSLPCHSPHRS